MRSWNANKNTLVPRRVLIANILKYIVISYPASVTYSATPTLTLRPSTTLTSRLQTISKFFFPITPDVSIMSPAPRLEHVANMHLDLASAIRGGSTPRGEKNWTAITGGTLDAVGSNLHAKILPGGGDYTTLYASEGVIELDVQMVAQDIATNDIFRFQNKGFIAIDAEIGKILTRDKEAKSTEFGEASALNSITCNTSSKEHAWLNFSILVGQGRLIVEAGKLVGIEIRVFKMEAK
ncbi:hypothetical protein V1505DRAFT_380805 [Lipomyces doorenjongii]